MIRLHHVQVSSPPGGEDEARAFWGDALGMSEVEKPEPLRARGGCWFRAEADGVVTAEVHVGVEADFRPARKAHPALVVDDLAAVADRLRAGGFEVDESERESFPGFLRLHTYDGAGNRVEVLGSRPSGGPPPAV